MSEPVLDFGGAEGMHVEADVFALPPIAVALERGDLIESDPKVYCSRMACPGRIQTFWSFKWSDHSLPNAMAKSISSAD